MFLHTGFGLMIIIIITIIIVCMCADVATVYVIIIIDTKWIYMNTSDQENDQMNVKLFQFTA